MSKSSKRQSGTGTGIGSGAQSTRDSGMTWEGIGPKLALITLPYVIMSLLMLKRDPEFLRLDILDGAVPMYAGWLLLVAGVMFWGWSAVVFLSDFRKGKLITRGPFGLCRNPIYASFIVFVLPALTLIFASGVVATIDVVLYVNFRISIHGERTILRRQFGEEYAAYERNVNELLPFPRFRA